MVSRGFGTAKSPRLNSPQEGRVLMKGGEGWIVAGLVPTVWCIEASRPVRAREPVEGDPVQVREACLGTDVRLRVPAGHVRPRRRSHGWGVTPIIYPLSFAMFARHREEHTVAPNHLRAGGHYPVTRSGIFVLHWLNSTSLHRTVVPSSRTTSRAPAEVAASHLNESLMSSKTASLYLVSTLPAR